MTRGGSIVAVLLAVACADSAEGPVCPQGLCASGAACDTATGRCEPSPPNATIEGELGSWSSAALLPDGRLLVASYDRKFRALALRDFGADGGGSVSWIDGGPAHPGGDDVGAYPALALGSDAEPRVAYYNRTHGALKLATRSAGGWTIETLDGASGADVGRYASLVVDSAGGVHVAYRDDTSRQLRIKSTRCPSNEVALPPPPGRPVAAEDYGEWASVWITGAGDLAISYYDAARGNLVLATCTGAGVSQRILDGEVDGSDSGDVGLWSSLATDDDGNAAVAYFDRTRGVLKFAQSDTTGAYQVVVVDDGIRDPLDPGAHIVGQGVALDFSADAGQPRLAYTDATSRAIRLARRSSSGSWTSLEVEAVGDETPLGGIGLGMDLAMAPGDHARIVYGRWTVAPPDGELSLKIEAIDVAPVQASP